MSEKKEIGFMWLRSMCSHKRTEIKKGDYCTEPIPIKVDNGLCETSKCPVWLKLKDAK